MALVHRRVICVHGLTRYARMSGKSEACRSLFQNEDFFTGTTLSLLGLEALALES